MRLSALAVLALPGLVSVAAAAPPKLTLDQVIARALASPRAVMADSDTAGAQARVEGKFLVKTLSKAQVDHMIAEDGAKFENRNPDGTVTEVSFEATGIELRRS